MGHDPRRVKEIPPRRNEPPEPLPPPATKSAPRSHPPTRDDEPRESMDQTSTGDNSDLSKHDVAVTVFARCEGADYRDASSIVEAALRALLREHGTRQDDRSSRIVLHLRDGDVPVDVHQVMDAGVAAANGYLWLRPTNRAFPWSDEHQ